MLLSHDGRNLYFDLAGPRHAPTIRFTHSLAADGCMWNEQLVPLLAAGWALVFLASDESSFMTGSEVIIDDGISAM